MKTGDSKGPKYDLVFGVYTYDPGVKTNVSISPYVIDGVLYLDAQVMPPNHGTTSAWIKLYRYSSKTGRAEQLPLPSPAEMPDIRGREQFNLSAAWHFTLGESEQSPDGYSLAAPNWVKAGFLANLVGNIMLFRVSGGFETIKVREENPRLANGSVSILMKSEAPLFANESENAFSLGWVVADDAGEATKKS